MRVRVVAHTVGMVLRYFALVMVLPLAVDWIYGFWM